ncbi:glycosyltransferase [Paenibacillus amylolyticus]|nr:glycosyltransferase [Paenibacillus amylolyticus]
MDLIEKYGDEMMKVTVAICTYNRAHDAVEAIRSAIQQNYASSDYEIILIDNNSKDNTREIVLQTILQHENHSIRYVLEEKQGLSVARNRAIHEAPASISCSLTMMPLLAGIGFARSLACLR